MLPTSQADHPQYHSNMAMQAKMFSLAVIFHEAKQKFYVHSQVPPRFSSSFTKYSQKGTVCDLFFFITQGTELITVQAGACLLQTQPILMKKLPVRKFSTTVSVV